MSRECCSALPEALRLSFDIPDAFDTLEVLILSPDDGVMGAGSRKYHTVGKWQFELGPDLCLIQVDVTIAGG